MIIDQLNRLSEIAPEVCKRNQFDVYQIGAYRFSQEDGIFHASCELPPRYNVYYAFDRPALAWLRDALEQVIEARGWQPGTVLSKDKGWIGQAANDNGFNIAEDYDTSCEALLAALLAALEGER